MWRARNFFKEEGYHSKVKENIFYRRIVDISRVLTMDYPIISIEDGMAEQDGVVGLF